MKGPQQKEVFLAPLMYHYLFLFRTVHKFCWHNQDYFFLMKPGGYYLDYFKIYDTCNKYFKKNHEEDVLVTEEIDNCKTPCLVFLQQPANQQNIRVLQ